MREKVPCLFCGEEAERDHFRTNRDRFLQNPCYACRGCGNYVVEEGLECGWKGSESDEAFRIACLVREKGFPKTQKPYGVLDDGYPKEGGGVTHYLDEWWTVSDLLAQFPKPNEMAGRALASLARLAKADEPMGPVSFTRQEAKYILFSRHDYPLRTMLDHLKGEGLIEYTLTPRELITSLTPKAWERLENSGGAPATSNRVFVAMWFDKEMDVLYKQGIKKAVEEVGFDCRRADDVPHNDKICDKIIEEIRGSRFVVADFTAGRCERCDKCKLVKQCRNQFRARGGVYFEAGFALGLGIPVIWTVRKDQMDSVHFDTEHYNHITYETADELKKKLTNRILATIGAGRKAANAS